MREMETHPGLTTADMALADEVIETRQKEAYYLLLNWVPRKELLIGDRYRLLHYLGRGGFGIVFAVHDQKTDRELALKFIHPGQMTTPRKRRRIEREFEIASRVQHPGLVHLHGLEEWQGILYLVMDFIPGETLNDWIERVGPRPWTEVAPLLSQLLDVLALMHGQGIVHRDLKPSNLILSPEGRLVLLDLGLTRDQGDTTRTSSTGELVGSPHYLPPELILGHPARPAADLYQLGLVLSFMLTGRHPFMDDDDESVITPSVLTRQLSCPLYLPRAEGMSSATRLTLQRCLEKDPKLRPRDAACLRRQLGSQSRLTWLMQRLRLRRPLRTALLALASLSLTILGFLWFTLPASRIAEQNQTLIARNALGRTLWTREPAKDEHLAGWAAGQGKGGKLILNSVYTPEVYPYTYTLDQITPRDFPIRLEYLNHQTLPDYDLNSVYKFMGISGSFSDYFDFYPFSLVSDLQKRDLDGDGQLELLLFTHQASGMFPSQLTILGQDRSRFRSVFSPGFFNHESLSLDFFPASGDGPLPPLALLTQSNPFCHYMLWVWNIKTIKTLIPPSFDAINTAYLKTQDLIVLPQRSRLVRNDWQKENRVAFFSPDSEIRVDVSANGQIVISGLKKRKFTENFQANGAALSILNRVFFHLSRQQSALAAQAMDKLDTSAINNPWLLSLIRYFQAETAIQNDDFVSADALLRQALLFDPDNGDARNRLAELAVLRQGPKAGLIFLEENTQYSGHFWGLANGQDLFRSSCLLMAGDIPAAEQDLSMLVDSKNTESPGRPPILQGLSILYGPDRKALMRVVDRLIGPQTNLSCLLDVTELQLILARLRMVGGDWQKAEPFLRQFTTQTVLHKPFAEVSLAWCEAEAGKTTAAVERADRAFTRIRRMARGQFWARYWLFYDAYAYGRTMDKTGQPQKAQEGYRLCADLAPHSFLGRESRERIDNR